MNINDYPLWTALVTPFNPDLSVDFDSLLKLINEQNEAKNGILILGSTGEALNISLNDKMKIINFICDMSLDVPVMAGVGGHDFLATKEWISFLETKNLDAYLLVTPLYAKPGNEGQYHWFKSLMDISTKPCMLYNVPSRTGISLSLDAVKRLAKHPSFWAIKEASGSVEKFTQYLEACNNGRVYCGDDGLFPEFCKAGSVGLISVASNAWPEQTNLYVKQIIEKRFYAHEVWEEACKSMFIASNPVPAKAFLFAQGRIANKTMMPPLHENDLDDLRTIQNVNSKVQTWFKTQTQKREEEWTIGKQL